MLYSLSTGYLYLYSLYLLAGAPKVCEKAIFLSNSIRQLLCADEYEMTFFLSSILFTSYSPLSLSFPYAIVYIRMAQGESIYLDWLSDIQLKQTNKKPLSRVESIWTTIAKNAISSSLEQPLNNNCFSKN